MRSLETMHYYVLDECEEIYILRFESVCQVCNHHLAYAITIGDRHC